MPDQFGREPHIPHIFFYPLFPFSGSSAFHKARRNLLCPFPTQFLLIDAHFCLPIIDF